MAPLHAGKRLPRACPRSHRAPLCPALAPRSYGPYKGGLDRVRKGALIASAGGRATLYALGGLDARGTLFVGPGAEVYEGQVVGECSRCACCLVLF